MKILLVKKFQDVNEKNKFNHTLKKNNGKRLGNAYSICEIDKSKMPKDAEYIDNEVIEIGTDTKNIENILDKTVEFFTKNFSIIQSNGDVSGGKELFASIAKFQKTLQGA